LIRSTPHGAPDYARGTLLYRGAEADIVKGRWQSLEAVFKVRKPLAYRLSELDESIRRQRTIREAEMVRRGRMAGVRVPHIYYVDVRASTLVMEYVHGPRVKDLLAKVSPIELRRIFERLGGDAARLHSAGIVHGDLTTANLVAGEHGLTLLDFGLSSYSTRVEDHAVDLRLIKETLEGAHSESAVLAIGALLSGYSTEAGFSRAAAVLRQLRSIERRGRYARVV
jgi:TP53 regulating kinase and related kinases